MLIRDAIERLDGHTIMTVKSAKDICQLLDIPFDDKLVMSWKDRQDAWDTYGFVATEQGPGSGVDGLDLSYYIAEQLGLGRPGSGFTGKGFQSRANQQAIRQKLSEFGKL